MPSEEGRYLCSIQSWDAGRYQFVVRRERETFQKMKTMLAFSEKENKNRVNIFVNKR